MSITLLLIALPVSNFPEVQSDPSLIRWLYEWAMLDENTTLKKYYIKLEELDEHDRQGIEQVDRFALQREDFFLIDYIQVSKELEGLTASDRRPLRVADKELVPNPLLEFADMYRALGAGPLPRMVPRVALGGPLVIDSPEDLGPLLKGDTPTPFKGEGELEFSQGLGNCTYWSPPGFAKSVIEDKAWLVAQRLDPELDGYIRRAIEHKRHMLALAY